ncbi:MAG: hypothetical protein GVY15_03110 [Bacteroidetes bacterium]|jgi:hypothetical protein|nr:hypothetical protein [Bacteroidota bacterium]
MRPFIPIVLTLLFVLGNTRVFAQHQTYPEYRDPVVATALSLLVPGGGHFYAGETATGVTLVATGFGAPLLGLALTMRSEKRICDGYGCRTEVNLTPLLVGSGVMLGAFVYGVADAGRAADRANRRRGVMEGVSVYPTAEVREGRIEPGFALRLVW